VIPSPKRRTPASASLFATVGYKLAEGKDTGKNDRDVKTADSKELWKSVENQGRVLLLSGRWASRLL
jgi:hypothetical protein